MRRSASQANWQIGKTGAPLPSDWCKGRDGQCLPGSGPQKTWIPASQFALGRLKISRYPFPSGRPKKSRGVPSIPDDRTGGGDVMDEDGTTKKIKRCIYTPHSLRATTATLLLDAGVDIIKVEELLGHRYVTTTQIYDKRRRSTKEGASRDVPI
jgi:integrase